MSGVTTFTDEIEQAAKDYINGGYKDLDQVIPSHVGMCRAIKVSESTLYKWAADGHGTFSETLKDCNTLQHEVLINKGLTSEFSSVITKLALSNHGYSEKTSTDVTSGGEKVSNVFNFVPVSSES